MNFSIRWPVPFQSRITQYFRENPDYYRQFRFPGHEGMDWGIITGTEICAVADGVVSEVNLAGNNHPYGNHLRIKHQEGKYETIYAHLSEVKVLRGQAVRVGEVVALSGNTGNSSKPHLHFTLKKKDATSAGETDYRDDIVDPAPYMEALPPGVLPPRPAPPLKTTLDVQVVAEDGLNLRNQAVTGDIIATLPNGTLVGSLEAEDITRRKLGQPNQWLWVRAADGRVGYMAAEYLSLPGAARGATRQAGAPRSEAYRLHINAPDRPVKLRQEAGLAQPVIGELPHAMLVDSLETPLATLEKLGEYGQWLEVRAPDGQTGYVAAWHLGWPVMDAQPEVPSEELRSLQADDLQRIQGIGPKTEKLLNAVGICTFQQLAALTLEQLRAVLAEGDVRGQLVASWAEQARAFSTS